MSDDNFLQPEDDTTISVINAEETFPGLAGYVKTKFDEAENGRYAHEQRCLQSFKNFRGVYDSTTQYRDSERSKVFVRITKTKSIIFFILFIRLLSNQLDSP